MSDTPQNPEPKDRPRLRSHPSAVVAWKKRRAALWKRIFTPPPLPWHRADSEPSDR